MNFLSGATKGSFPFAKSNPRLRRFGKNFAQQRESLVFYRIVIPAVRMRDEFIANLQTRLRERWDGWKRA
ncbi:hypothetical protein [Parvibacter caecicola]|uniref:hypothetical protein n=1 Tax=Parvibacter caecicola TaxID=747645 RepID=UPI001B7FB42D|nr:hypothetical protein [Parvibacter caecicola]